MSRAQYVRDNLPQIVSLKYPKDLKNNTDYCYHSGFPPELKRRSIAEDTAYLDHKTGRNQVSFDKETSFPHLLSHRSEGSNTGCLGESHR